MFWFDAWGSSSSWLYLHHFEQESVKRTGCQLYATVRQHNDSKKRTLVSHTCFPNTRAATTINKMINGARQVGRQTHFHTRHEITSCKNQTISLKQTENKSRHKLGHKLGDKPSEADTAPQTNWETRPETRWETNWETSRARRTQHPSPR